MSEVPKSFQDPHPSEVSDDAHYKEAPPLTPHEQRVIAGMEEGFERAGGAEKYIDDELSAPTPEDYVRALAPEPEQPTAPVQTESLPPLENNPEVRRQLDELSARFRETQALLPPYEDKIEWKEQGAVNVSRWKRFTSLFSRRKGSEQAWYPEQRTTVTTLAVGSAALVPVFRFDSPIEPDPNYPSVLTNTQQRRV